METLDRLKPIISEILEQAERDEHGLFWRSFTNLNGKKSSGTQLDLYCGVSGVAFLFMQLYQTSGNVAHKQTLDDSIQWIKQNAISHPFKNQSFFTGRTGVAWLVAAYEQKFGTGDFSVVYELVKQCRLDASSKCELLNGIAGEVLGYIHLYAITEYPPILPLIDQCLEHLLQRVNYNPAGIVFDNNPFYAASVTGFSHGLAGIAFVLMQIGKFSGNDAWVYLAEQVICAENNYYLPKINNWVDTRKVGVMGDFVNRLKAVDKTFFKTVADSATWCYGAPGIGFSRFLAYQVTGKSQYHDEFISAVNKVVAVMRKPGKLEEHYNLCHGLAGNAMLLLEAHQDQSDLCYDWVDQVKESILIHAEKGKTLKSGCSTTLLKDQIDVSLFTGLSGMVNYVLQVENPTLFNVLNPTTDFENLAVSDFSNINLSKPAIIRQLFTRCYPQSSRFLNDKALKSLTSSRNEIDIRKVDLDADSTQLSFWHETENVLYLKEQNTFFNSVRLALIRFKAIQKLDLNQQVFLNPDVAICKNDGSYYLVLHHLFPIVAAHQLNDDEYEILRLFNGNEIGINMAEIVGNFKHGDAAYHIIADFWQQGILIGSEIKELDAKWGCRRKK